MKQLGILLLVFSNLVYGGHQIAITFDDAPKPDAHFSAEERTDRLMKALKKAGVDQAMFFVTTKHLTADKQAIIKKYADAGHLIANHSDQHLWLHKSELKTYQDDFLKAHSMLKDQPHFRPFFRFPYLDEGREEASRQSMLAFLAEHGYRNGYVTVDNYDWYLNSLFQEAMQSGSPVNLWQLKQLYVDVLWEAIQFSDQMAIKYLGRSPKHVLLLHDNDLAALFIDDLVAHLKSKGWEIIPVESAYQDPIAEQMPQTLFNGQGRVAALAHEAGAKPRDLVHVNEDKGRLKQLFEEFQVVTNNSQNMPDWLQAEMNLQVGLWQTSNAVHQSKNEPFSHYLIEWTWGLGKQSINGRLYALNAGQPSGDFWHFKQYWDPVNHEARLLQWGQGGMVGDGVMKPNSDGQMITIQSFASPAISAYQEKHLTYFTDDGLVTTSFGLDDAGDWSEKRSYLWVKQEQ